jgi:mono/diheme cytochrome c family protein
MSALPKLAAAALVAFTLAAAPRTILEGVYSTEQAARGEDAYNRNCARCHQPDLAGTGGAPALITTTFTDNWREGYLSNLFHHIQTWMPPQNLKGTLPEQRYLDILTYILSVNEFPAGPKELTTADLNNILFVGHDGPQPLPAAATVRAVGCFARDAGWSLTRVGETPRVQDGSNTYAAELGWSSQAALGSTTFVLSNVDDDRKESDLLPLIGRKVQVKGVLGTQAGKPRISVFSLEALPPGAGPQCAP